MDSLNTTDPTDVTENGEASLENKSINNEPDHAETSVEQRTKPLPGVGEEATEAKR